MKNKKIIIISVASVIVLALGLGFYLKGSPKNEFTLETTKMAVGNVSRSITATGTIEPIIKVNVGTQVSGIISKIYVDYNSEVRKGDMLAEIEKTALQADFNSKTLALNSSRIEFQYQQKNFERSKELHDKKLISDTDFETAKYTYEKSESSYRMNESDLVKVKNNLSYATIYSPIDGVVLSRAVEEGQTVAASFNTPTLFIIAKDLTKMQVVANVDEADIGEVKMGQRVSFTVDAYPNDVFDGEVTQVRLEATVTSNVVTYQVIVNAPNPSLKLKPGLTANISIYTMEKNDVNTLPNKALNYRPDTTAMQNNGYTILKGEHKGEWGKKETDAKGFSERPANKKGVWVQDGKNIIRKHITIGETDGINTEIVNGLTLDDAVILESKSLTDASNKSKEVSPFMPFRPRNATKK